MVGETEPIRPKDKRRMGIIKKHCGCLCCLLMGWLDVHATIEHITERGRRIGHHATLGLCGWHHFGHCHKGKRSDYMQRELGPSLADGRKPFEDHFGDEREILLPVQNFMLARFAADPWPEYNLPGNVAIDTRNQWIELNHATAQSPSLRPSESG